MGGWIRSSNDPFIALNSRETSGIALQTAAPSSVIDKAEPKEQPPALVLEGFVVPWD